MKFLKWVSSLGVISSMLLTAYNVYPLNLYVALPATIGWIYISIQWKDNALITMNSVALFIYILGVINYEI